MKKFNLKIKLGNEAMQSCQDIADALRKVVEKLDSGRISGKIIGLNGNSVGEFEIK